MTDIAPSENKIQQEGVTFNQPVSEATQTSIGALANFLRETILPIGSVVYTMLTESQFQSQNTSPAPPRWILADGRDVTGSAYANLTSFTTVPDLRGIFVRGKNNGRSDGNQNPDGDLALGAFQSNQFGTHDHGFSDPGHGHSLSYTGLGQSPFLRINAYSGGSGISATDGVGSNALIANSAGTGITFSANGGNETRPNVATVNAMIRIN